MTDNNREIHTGKNNDQDSLDNVLKYTEDALSLLEKQYKHPWVNLSSRLSNRILMFLSSLRSCFSDEQRKKFRSSAEKRSPYRFINQWPSKKISFPRQNFDNENNILVLDYRLPRSDTSAGEKASFGILKDLCSLGFNVTFVPEDMKKVEPYWQQIANLGAKVITHEDGYLSLEDYINKEGHIFGTYYFIRVDVAEKALPIAENVAPIARKIFHAPDLSFLREIRAAELSGDTAALQKANETKYRELDIMYRCDHVVAVSPVEVYLLKEVIPDISISVFPALYVDVETDIIPYNKRDDIFFLGGFSHAPNVDSVLWFCHEIWPLIHEKLPDVKFHIIGAEAPEKVRKLGNIDGINFIGYVEELKPVLEKYRVGVAPLRYGAGIKGKVATTMGAGVPCICTSIAAEGMGIEHGYNGLVTDDPHEFANAVVRVYEEERLWSELSIHGVKFVKEKFGEEANRTDFFRVLQAARALPLPLYQNYILAQSETSFPVYDKSTPINVSIIIPVYNKWHLTEACLKSIIDSCRGLPITYEVILADDNSSDTTIQANQIFSGLKIARTKTKSGFLVNCNNAAKKASGQYLLFLSNDTIVLPNWLNSLYDIIKSNDKIAIAGSKLLSSNGIIKEAGGKLFQDGTRWNLGRGKERYDLPYNVTKNVDYISIVSILVDKKFWDKNGGFDKQYKSAYCEDLDLAMAAHHEGLDVVYVPQSEVIHFEDGSYIDEMKTHLRNINIEKLTQKWHENIENFPEESHWDFEKDELKAIAFSENTPSQKALERRKSGNLNILYFSPFPSHPNNHGNQATIQAFGKKFQDFGHKIHFALLESQMYSANNIKEMKEDWDSLTIIPNNLQLYSNGQDIPFDGWYEEGLNKSIYELCHKYDIDVVFFSYIFQSKMLDYVPRHILKIIDTHDKMGGRYDMLRKNKQPLEFFSCSEEEEGQYLRRADIVVARRQQEADYFNKTMGQNTAVVIPHIEDAQYLNKTSPKIKDVGIVASANRINLISMHDFLKAYNDELNGRKSPVTIHIAGQVKDMVAGLSKEEQSVFNHSWVKMHGFVPDIKDFYDSVDIIMSPIMMGTGINVKTVQAMAYGMPILATEIGIKGIETGDIRHNHKDLSSLVKTLLEIRDDGNELNRLAALSRARYDTFTKQHFETMKNIFTTTNLL